MPRWWARAREPPPRGHARAFHDGRRPREALQGEEVGAVSRLEEIVEKDPLDGESILLLADYYGRNEKAEKAELFYQRAEQIDLFEVRAKISHAQFHVARNNYNKALPLLRDAQAKRPRENVQQYLNQVEKLAKLKAD